MRSEPAERPGEPRLWQTIDHALRKAGGRGDLDRLAAEAGYSRFHLSRLIRRATGMPLTGHVARWRIAAARRLLATTDRPVTEVALAVGFASLGTFSRRFRSLTDLSPSEFRTFARSGSLPVRPGRRAPGAGRSGEGSAGSRPGGGRVSGWIHCPAAGAGWVHVGLFRRESAEGLPVAWGRVERPGPFLLEGVPPGIYRAFAAACCCHPAFAGDASGAWAAGAAPEPVTVAGPHDHVEGVAVHLAERWPPAPPLMAVFPEGGNGGEAAAGTSGVRCGLGPMPEGADGMDLGVASVVVYVADMERSVDFYRRLLGAEVSHRNPTVATLVQGGLRLILHRDKLPERAGVRGAMEFNLAVPDAGAFHAALAGRGIAADPPQRFPWGWVGFAVTDPDGNVVEVYEQPR